MKRDTLPPAPGGTPVREEASSTAASRQAGPQPEQDSGRDARPAARPHGPRLGPSARLRKGRPGPAACLARRKSAQTMALAERTPSAQGQDAPAFRLQGQGRPQGSQTFRKGRLPWRMQALPRPLGRYWVPVSQAGGLKGDDRLFWPLVLDALGLPRWLEGPRRSPVLYVPCLVEKLARAELEDFAAEPERARLRMARPPKAHPYAAWALLILVPVFLLHLARWGWRPEALPFLHPLLDAFPGQPSAWTAGFGLDTVRVTLFHEWPRACTALFLHADIQHLAGNLVFSCLFLWLLGRACGPGWAMLLTLAGGLAGNLVDAWARPLPVTSIGFSTALFASIGALSGWTSIVDRAMAVPPLAAGGALLAMLGSEGENTDYIAHMAGLACGMAFGIALRMACRRQPGLASPIGQALATLAAFVVPLICFWLRMH